MNTDMQPITSLLFTHYCQALLLQHEWHVGRAAELGWYDLYTSPLVIPTLHSVEGLRGSPPYTQLLALRGLLVDHFYALGCVVMVFNSKGYSLLPLRYTSSQGQTWIHYLPPYDAQICNVAQLAWQYSLRGQWWKISEFVNRYPGNWVQAINHNLGSSREGDREVYLDFVRELRLLFPQAPVWRPQ